MTRLLSGHIKGRLYNPKAPKSCLTFNHQPSQILLPHNPKPVAVTMYFLQSFVLLSTLSILLTLSLANPITLEARDDNARISIEGYSDHDCALNHHKVTKPLPSNAGGTSSICFIQGPTPHQDSWDSARYWAPNAQM